MSFRSNDSFRHDQALKTGILLVNLGSPDAPEPGALKRYLKEFLSDPRVIEVPRLLWWLILNGIILQVRPKRSARAYASVWTDNGSPLLAITREQTRLIREKLQDSLEQAPEVEFAMRYGNPSINHVIDKMLANGVRELVVLPLYPQYSATTTASTFDAIAQDFSTRRWLPGLRFINHYHDFPDYITACSRQILRYQQQHGTPDKLVFSYHGLPLRYLHNGDPYHCECLATSRKIAEKLGLQPDQYLTSFQSRFGREPWLQPYTDESLKKMGKEGISSVQVFCPGFPADCLETLEEIAVENKAYFLENGGKDFAYIPALNTEPEHIDALTSLLKQQLQGLEQDKTEKAGETRRKLFENHPYNQKP